MFVNDCTVTIDDTTFTDNASSHDDGGAITVDSDGGVEVTGSSFSGNTGDDVYLKSEDDTYSYGTSEDFTCDDEECW